MLGSGFNPGAAATNDLRRALAAAQFRLRNYPEAIRHGSELIRAGAAGEDVYTVVGQSYYQTRNYGEAIKLFGNLVSNEEKAGRRPDRNQLNILYSAYDKAGNAAAAQTTLEKLVRHYPTPDTWLVLLYEVKREKLDPRQRLHTYRLMESTGNLKQGADFMEYYGAAASLKLHQEGHRVLAAGGKAGAFARMPEADRNRAERYTTSARTLADSARAELPKLESAAKSAPNGEAYVDLGMQQVSFEMYPQAITSIQAGLAKGGLKNEIDAQMTLGYAQFKAGQKAEALKTLRAIKGGDVITQRLIKFWILHIQ
jgi:tetratricopeptide (TPR) repeat protein